MVEHCSTSSLEEVVERSTTWLKGVVEQLFYQCSTGGTQALAVWPEASQYCKSNVR